MASPLPSHVRNLYFLAPEGHRKTMLAMRIRILKAAPKAEEIISYGMPAFRVQGKVVAGIMSCKSHIGFYPFSGSVLPHFKRELKSYSQTKSALHIPIGKPLSQSLTTTLVRARISQCKFVRGERQLSHYSERDSHWKALGLAAPARRGLVDLGLFELKDLARVTERELLNIHAIGPKASYIIKHAMRKSRIKFKP